MGAAVLELMPQDRMHMQLLALCPGRDKEIRAILDQYVIINKVVLDGGRDIKDKMRIFLSAKRLEGLSKNTIDGYRMHILRFANEVGKRTEDITSADIRSYLGQYTELKNSTISTMLSVFKSFFSWLSSERVIPFNPAQQIKPPKKEKRLPKALTPEELETIRENCMTVRQKALVEVLYSTGCRLSELVAMNKTDINYSSHTAKVIGKGNKERTVYFSWKALRYLKEYLNTRTDDNVALFVTERKPHKRIGDRGIQLEIEKIAARACLNKDVHPHVFRHTLATHLLADGADLVTVQKILGHEDPATTQIYATVTEQHARQAFERCMSK